MVVDKDMKLRQRIIDVCDPLLKSFQHAAKAMILDQKQQLFLRFAVMIETGEAHPRRPRNVAHGRRVITLLGKDARGRAQNVLELLVVARELLHRSIASLSHWVSLNQ